MPQVNTSQLQNMYSIKLRRSLYDLKQFGRMWYNCLSEYLIKDGYINNPICPCIFIKKLELGFVILVVYVDNINLFRTPEELTKAATYLKDEFEMKDKNFLSKLFYLFITFTTLVRPNIWLRILLEIFPI